MTDDLAFFERRLREELARAENEAEPRVRQLHRGWADLYQERLNGLQREGAAPYGDIASAVDTRPTPRVAADIPG